MTISVRTGKHNEQTRKARPSDKSTTGSAPKEYPPREWYKLDIGGLSAKPGDFGEIDAVCTAIKFQRPFKKSHDKSKPLHILEFFDPATGEEYSMIIDTKLNKKGKLRQDFFGGLLLNLGERVSDDDILKKYEWYNPAELDASLCGGAFKLSPSFFGVPIIIGREAKEIQGDNQNVTLQVFYYDTYTDEKIAELFPSLEEYVLRYNEDGTYTEEFWAAWKAEHGEKDETNNQETEDAIELAIELLNGGTGKLAAIKELQGVLGCGMNAAKDVVFEAAKRIDSGKGAEKAPAKAAPAKKPAVKKAPAPEPEEEDEPDEFDSEVEEEAAAQDDEPAQAKVPGPKITRDSMVTVITGRLKNGAKNSDVLKELKEDYGQPLSEAKEILKAAQARIASSGVATSVVDAANKAKGEAKSKAAKARAVPEKTQPVKEETEPDPEFDPNDDDGPSPLQEVALEIINSGKSIAAAIKELMAEYELDKDVAKSIVESVLDSDEPVESSEDEAQPTGEVAEESEGNSIESLLDGQGVVQGKRADVIAVLTEELEAGTTAKGSIAKRLVGVGLTARQAAAIAGKFIEANK